jgi:long-chain acyl-CoA synthetase
VSNFKEYFASQKLTWPGDAQLFLTETVKNVIDAHVKKINESLAPFEQLKRYQLIHGSWNVETGEVTPKLSLRRKVIMEKNKQVLAKIFGESG